MKLKITSNNQLEIRENSVSQILPSVAFIGLGLTAVYAGLRAEEGGTMFIILGSVFALVGALVAFKATKTEIILRNNSISTKRTSTIITKKESIEEFAPEQIQSVALESSTSHIRSSDGGSRRERASILYLNLDDNRQVILMTKKSGAFSVNGIDVSSFGKAPLSKEAQQIADFFGKPLENRNNGIPSIGNIIKNVRDNINQD